MYSAVGISGCEPPQPTSDRSCWTHAVICCCRPQRVAALAVKATITAFAKISSRRGTLPTPPGGGVLEAADQRHGAPVVIPTIRSRLSNWRWAVEAEFRWNPELLRKD